MKTICVTNQKGGVAKTTTAIHLAHGLALLGKRVLIVDFDPQGQAATALRVDLEPGIFNLLINRQANVRETGRGNLHILPGDSSTATTQTVINVEGRSISAVRDALKGLSHLYDYMIFDTAPSAGGIQERAIFASDAALLPTATEFLSSDGLMKGIELISNLKEQRGWKGSLLGILPTFYDDVSKESKDTLADLRANFQDAVFDPIHRATILRECASEGITVFEKDPGSRAAIEYSHFVEGVLKRI